MPHSHHSHSGQFCRHAKDTLEQVVLEAIRQGFEVFGLSEHAPRYRLEDLFPEEVGLTFMETLDANRQSDLTAKDLESAYLSFLEEAVRLRDLYADRVSLLIGLETDYITDIDLDRTSQLLDRHTNIDYIVGSVHHVNGVSIDFDRPTWVRAVRTVVDGQYSSTMQVSPVSGKVSLPSVDDAETLPSIEDIRVFLLAYFDAQYEMLQRHRPEVVGHIDLCLLWIPEQSLRSERMEAVWEKVVRNVKFVVSYGGLFEANAAAIRKGWKGSYPNPGILQVGQRAQTDPSLM